MAQFLLFNCCSLALILPCTFLPFSANPTLSECLPDPTYISPQNVLTNLWDISFGTTRPSSLRKKKKAHANLCKTHTAVCNFNCYCVCGLYLYLAPVPKECLQPPPPTKDALSSRRLSHFAKGRRSPRTTAFVDFAPPTLLLPLLPLYKEATEHFAFVVATVAVSRQIAPTAGKKYANKKKKTVWSEQQSVAFWQHHIREIRFIFGN